MKEKYFFDLDQRFAALIKECILTLKTLGVPISNSIYFGFNGGYSYFGRTYFKPRVKKCAGYDFYVTVNKFLINDADIVNTVAHELLHTVKGGMNHRGAWRKYADIVNKLTEYKITVYGKSKLQTAAYKRKKAFSIKEYDPETMDVVYCPKCGNRLCLRKGLKKTILGKSAYLCAKCRVNFIYEK